MKPGELRRFSDSVMARAYLEGSTFVVLRVDPASARARGVDILIDGRHETDLGYHWVRDRSEVLNEAG